MSSCRGAGIRFLNNLILKRLEEKIDGSSSGATPRSGRERIHGLSQGKARLLARLTRRRSREREGLVLLEGYRVIDTAQGGGYRVRFALLSTEPTHDEERVAGALEEDGAEIREVEPEILRSVADTESPQGLLAVVEEPEGFLPPPADVAGKRGLVLLLDGVQDPGNVGTLIRSAAALGAERVLALDGTADPWSAKAVRAAAGFGFRIPVHSVSLASALEWLDATRTPLMVADAKGTDVRLITGAPDSADGPAVDREGREVPDQEGVVRVALLVGNEAAGPREEAMQAATQRVALPMAPGIESLNVAVAGSILLWALGPGRTLGGSPS